MRSAPIVCSEESPLPASVYDNYAVRRFAAGGLVRRLWLGSGIWCPMGFSPASVPEGFQRASGKPFGEPAGAYPLPRVGTDAPTTVREWDLPSYGALTLFFRWRKKSVQKKASGTATPEAAHVAMHCGQALRCAWAWLRASWLSAISGASRPSASLGRGLRSAVAERLDAPNLFGASNSGP